MIKGVHAMLYTDKAEADRAFFRDKLKLRCHDVGDGWLIFDVPEGEVGCHPFMEPGDKPHQEFSFYCDDVKAERAALEGRGVEFSSPLEDRGWGIACEFKLPGGSKCTLYQPRYTKG